MRRLGAHVAEGAASRVLAGRLCKSTRSRILAFLGQLRFVRTPEWFSATWGAMLVHVAADLEMPDLASYLNETYCRRQSGNDLTRNGIRIAGSPEHSYSPSNVWHGIAGGGARVRKRLAERGGVSLPLGVRLATRRELCQPAHCP